VLDLADPSDEREDVDLRNVVNSGSVCGDRNACVWTISVRVVVLLNPSVCGWGKFAYGVECT